MTGMPAGLKARVVADCKAAEERRVPAAYVPRPRGGDGPTVDALILRRELAEGVRHGMARVAVRDMAAANPQVTALSQVLDTPLCTEDLQKLADLGQRAGRKPRTREILTDPKARAEKLSIETCRTHPLTGEVLPLPPLEPWTCPVRVGLVTYAEIMLTADGATRLADYTGDRLTAVQWMRDEELVSVGDDGSIHGLSDGRPPATRAYPGAPCGDKRAAIGRQLRQHAVGLVLAALVNLSSGKTVRRGRKRSKGTIERGDGVKITAAQVATEANTIKAKRADLAEFRYLSLSTARQLIRALVDTGIVHEIQPPTPVRQRRSWRMLPRVIERITADLADRLGLRSQLQEAA